MKKRNVVAIAVAIVLCGASMLYGAASVKYNLFPYKQVVALKEVKNKEERQPYYLDRKDFFEAHGKQADIVMVGDSITDRAEWSELLGHPSIANRGINSDTTGGVLERISSIQSVQAKKAFIMIGINDIAKGRSSNYIFDNYVKIIEQLQSTGTTPFIQSTLLAGADQHNYNPTVIELNALLADYASRKGVAFINLNTVLSKDNLLKEEYTTDGVHLKSGGYTEWAKILKPYL